MTLSQQQQHDIQRNDKRHIPITSRSSATSSAPPVATLRSLRANGEEEVEEVEEEAKEIDGGGVAELDDALLLEG